MNIQLAGGLLCLVLSVGALGCTANVEDPEANVDQSGNQSDCTKECDEARTTCTGKCDDDSCKGSCTTEYDDCTKKCD